MSRESLDQIRAAMGFISQGDLKALLQRAVDCGIYHDADAKAYYVAIAELKAQPAKAEMADNLLRTVVMQTTGAMAKRDPGYVNLFAHALSVHKSLDEAVVAEIGRMDGFGAWQCNALIQYLKSQGNDVAQQEARYRQISGDLPKLKQFYCELWRSFILNKLHNTLLQMPADKHAKDSFEAWAVFVVTQQAQLDAYQANNASIHFSVDFLNKTLLGGAVMTRWFEIGLECDPDNVIVDTIVGDSAAQWPRPSLAKNVASFAVNPKVDAQSHKLVMPDQSLLDRALFKRCHDAREVGPAANALLREMTAVNDEASRLSAIRSTFVKLVDNSNYTHKPELVHALRRSVSRDTLEFVCKATLRLLHKKQGFIFRQRRLSESDDLLQQLKENPAFAFLGDYLQNFERSWSESFGLFTLRRAASPAADNILNQSQAQLLAEVARKTP